MQTFHSDNTSAYSVDSASVSEEMKENDDDKMEIRNAELEIIDAGDKNVPMKEIELSRKLVGGGNETGIISKDKLSTHKKYKHVYKRDGTKKWFGRFSPADSSQDVCITTEAFDSSKKAAFAIDKALRQNNLGESFMNFPLPQVSQTYNGVVSYDGGFTWIAQHRIKKKGFQQILMKASRLQWACFARNFAKQH